MQLTWKDAAATAIIGAAAVISYAKAKGFDWPLLGSWRIGSLLLLVLGFAGCIIVGSGAVPAKNAWTTIGTVLGIGAFILGVAGLIFGRQLLFWLLLADIVGLWLLATIHHLATSK